MSQTIEIILDQTTKSATHPPSTLCRMPRTRKIRKHTFTLNHLDRNSAPQSNISPLEEVPAEFTEETHNAKEAFLLFLENGILTHIVKHTNKRMARRNALRYDVARNGGRRPVGRPSNTGAAKSWSKPLTAEEFKIWLSLFFAMGLAKQPTLHHYWRLLTEETPFGSLFFRPRMQKARWLEIFRFVPC